MSQFYWFLVLRKEVRSIQIQKQIDTFETLKSATECLMLWGGAGLGVCCEFWWVCGFGGFFV